MDQNHYSHFLYTSTRSHSVSDLTRNKALARKRAISNIRIPRQLRIHFRELANAAGVWGVTIDDRLGRRDPPQTPPSLDWGRGLDPARRIAGPSLWMVRRHPSICPWIVCERS